MGQVNIEIGGRVYRMACDDGEEERLLALGAAFDETIRQLKQSFGEIGDRRLTVMAGLMAADEAAGLRERIAALQGENAALKAALTAAAQDERADEALAETIDRVARRIDALAHLLNETVRAGGSP